ncbi:hypothetical protein [Oleiagrimonas sp. MCCC 1A03011]|uniref:hypothetical protein n=1 Tax=Oleiagrimonas sp. MCCC 1A03011 TaxID=1926883 RepID=UPI0011BD9F9B|nr:hypothetical protein [Oleiagrimonas sp. MCCC 1A03011]
MIPTLEPIKPALDIDHRNEDQAMHAPPVRKRNARTFLQRLLHAYAPLRDRAILLDQTFHLSAWEKSQARSGQDGSPYAPVQLQELPLGTFLACLRKLQRTESEWTRRRIEKVILELAEPLKKAGVFELVQITHPAIAAMVSDHLADLEA